MLGIGVSLQPWKTVHPSLTHSAPLTHGATRAAAVAKSDALLAANCTISGRSAEQKQLTI